MKFYKIFVLGFLAMSFNLSAQQIPNSSMISETRAAWNPAFTANGNEMIIDGFFRMQWLGFSGAPVSGYASFQYPLADYNMSAGALINIDRTGPVSKVGLQLNYAYKVKEFMSKYGQMALGVSANFQQYSLNTDNAIVNDANDKLIGRNTASVFFPAIGGGFFYNSSTREYRENSFYVGAAMNKAFATDVLVNDFNQVRQNHIHFNVGGKIYSYNSFFEPMLIANYVSPDILDVLYSLKYEMRDAFWCGLGYASSGTLGVQGGLIMDRFGSKYAKLRVGGLFSYGLGDTLARTGPNFEFYVGYYLDTK